MTAFVPVLVAAACVAAAFDVRCRRIPNVLSGALAIAGIAVAGTTRGLPGVGVALALRSPSSSPLGTYAFARGWFGGGDVKLIAAGCCGLVPAHAADLFLYTALCGGLLSLYALVSSRRIVTVLLTQTLPADR